MKKIILITAIICLINVIAYAIDNDSKQQRNMNCLIDSYHYGKNDNKCSDIYYNYGTDKWTFNSDDPALLKKLYEACKVGEEDRITGRNNLPELLDALQRQQ